MNKWVRNCELKFKKPSDMKTGVNFIIKFVSRFLKLSTDYLSELYAFRL